MNALVHSVGVSFIAFGTGEKLPVSINETGNLIITFSGDNRWELTPDLFDLKPGEAKEFPGSYVSRVEMTTAWDVPYLKIYTAGGIFAISVEVLKQKSLVLNNPM
jgi:hypothetical protein